MLQNDLSLLLITYNRRQKLQETLNAILSNNSPVKNCSITILDNCSTDGTSEMIEQFITTHPNIRHIRHPLNIGGNANICRAFEMGACSGKAYFWVLCDDDKYDFSNWAEVTKAMEAQKDIICCAEYIFPSAQDKTDPAYQIFQLTFVPAGIYKSSLLTGDTLINMYDAISVMFPQSCVAIQAINTHKTIHALSKPIVFNGLHFPDKVDSASLSYKRGNESWRMDRIDNMRWILGFSNILSLVKDKTIQEKCMAVAIPYKDIYGNWENFYNCVGNLYLNPTDFNYFLEIYKMLPSTARSRFKSNFSLKIKPPKFDSGKLHLSEYVFSVRNEGRHKVLRILGIKITFRRKKI